jgi:hypothetical protein
MDAQQQVSVVVGMVLPPFIAILQKEQWSPGVKAVTALFLCLLVTGGVEYTTGGFKGLDSVTAFGLMFTTAVTSYHGLWKPSGVTDNIEKNVNG